MSLFLKLLLAHLLGDFLLQPKAWVDSKMQLKLRSAFIYVHVFIHLILIMVLAANEMPFYMAFPIAFSHLLIDLIKIYSSTEKTMAFWFVLDQLMHLSVLILVAEWYDPFLEDIISNIIINDLILLAICIILITKVGSLVIKHLISRWTPEETGIKNISLQSAGSYIGMLERLFVFGFIIFGYVEAIGFLIAAKSVFRFSDLRSQGMKMTEYILIGTLISFGWACLVALIYLSVAH